MLCCVSSHHHPMPLRRLIYCVLLSWLLLLRLHNGYQISIVNLHLNIAIVLLLDHSLVGRVVPCAVHALRRGEAQLHDEWELGACVSVDRYEMKQDIAGGGSGDGGGGGRKRSA